MVLRNGLTEPQISQLLARLARENSQTIETELTSRLSTWISAHLRQGEVVGSYSRIMSRIKQFAVEAPGLAKTERTNRWAELVGIDLEVDPKSREAALDDLVGIGERAAKGRLAPPLHQLVYLRGQLTDHQILDQVDQLLQLAANESQRSALEGLRNLGGETLRKRLLGLADRSRLSQASESVLMALIGQSQRVQPANTGEEQLREQLRECFQQWATRCEARANTRLYRLFQTLAERVANNELTREQVQTGLQDLTKAGEDLINRERIRLLHSLSKLDGERINAVLEPQLDRLAAQGRRSVTGLSLPGFAGTTIHLNKAMLAKIGASNPALAQRVMSEGIYVNLNGLIDLAAYSRDDLPAVRLQRIEANRDLGKEWRRFEDLRRGYSTYLAHFQNGEDLLAEAPLHYVRDGRFMAPLPVELPMTITGIDPERIDCSGQVLDGEPNSFLDAELPTRRPDGEIKVNEPELVSKFGEQGTYRKVPDTLPLFVRDGDAIVITPEQVKQGRLGDCGLIATLRSIAAQMPGILKDVVEDNHDGTFTVRLFSTKIENDQCVAIPPRIAFRVKASLPRDANGSLLYARSAVALWGPIIEKAFAGGDLIWSDEQQQLWQESWDGEHGSVTEHAGQIWAAPTGYNIIEDGSTPLERAAYLTRITGKPTAVASFPEIGGHFDPDTLGKKLAELLASGKPVLVSTKPSTRWDEGNVADRARELHLIAKHVYHVDSVTDKAVLLSNPHGESELKEIPLNEADKLLRNCYVHLAESVQPAATPEPAPAPAPTPVPRPTPVPAAPVPAPGSPQQREGRSFITAVGVPGTLFTVALSDHPNRQEVLDAANDLLGSEAEGNGGADRVRVLAAGRIASIHRGNDGRYLVTPQSGAPFTIRIVAGDLRGSSNHGSRDVLARTTADPDHADGFLVMLSEHLDLGVVSEVLTHELGELAACPDAAGIKQLASDQQNRLTSDGLATSGPLSAHDHGGLAQLDYKALQHVAFRGQGGWPWVKNAFETAALAKHLGLIPHTSEAAKRLELIAEEQAVAPETLDLLTKLRNPSEASADLSPFEREVFVQAVQLATTPAFDQATRTAAFGRSVHAIATGQQRNNPDSGLLVQDFVDSWGTGFDELATVDPVLHQDLTTLLGERNRLHDAFRGHLQRLSINVEDLGNMAVSYHEITRDPEADNNNRIGILDTLTDLADWYRQATTYCNGWQVLPATVPAETRTFLDGLVLPVVTSESLRAAAENIAADPMAIPATSAEAQANDYVQHLVEHGSDNDPRNDWSQLSDLGVPLEQKPQLKRLARSAKTGHRRTAEVLRSQIGQPVSGLTEQELQNLANQSFAVNNQATSVELVQRLEEWAAGPAERIDSLSQQAGGAEEQQNDSNALGHLKEFRRQLQEQGLGERQQRLNEEQRRLEQRLRELRSQMAALASTVESDDAELGESDDEELGELDDAELGELDAELRNCERIGPNSSPPRGPIKSLRHSNRPWWNSNRSKSNNRNSTQRSRMC